MDTSARAMRQRVMLQPVDAIEVTIVVDNFVDLLMAGTETVRRAPPAWDTFERDALLAEHGFSLLVKVEREGRAATVLYDAGLGQSTALHNLDVLGTRIPDLRAIVLSHGHMDHHGGLEGIVRRLGHRGLPLLLHPDAWRDRKVVFPTGAELHLPPPSRHDLEQEGVEITEERSPSLLLDGTVLVTGQVERVTSFEKGFPLQHARTQEGWEPDPWVWDDQAAVFHLREKGLVVLSGCSHAGIINVVRHARAVTGMTKVHAVVGGLHLTGGIFEPIIPDTIREMMAIGPAVVVPCHCTGWRALQELARHMPDAYVHSSVGTSLRFA
jgi:7,8-dihydropterin-6-yl-methyl-4-(beta-D-ribofuranosyl)aminobenzene 5'-phosphate synthase